MTLKPTKEVLIIFGVLFFILPLPFYVVFTGGFVPTFYIFWLLLLGPEGILLFTLVILIDYIAATILVRRIPFDKLSKLLILATLFSLFVPIYYTSGENAGSGNYTLFELLKHILESFTR